MSGMVTIEEFRPVLKNTLRGFASVAFPSGMIVEEVSLHVSEGRPCLGLGAGKTDAQRDRHRDAR